MAEISVSVSRVELVFCVGRAFLYSILGFFGMWIGRVFVFLWVEFYFFCGESFDVFGIRIWFGRGRCSS